MDKYNAGVSLRNAAYSPKILLAIHSGALIGLSLLLSLVSYILNKAIQPSGGLESLGLQAVLATAQLVLQMTQLVVTPFWTAGLCYAAIGIARGRKTVPSDLLMGFNKILPIVTSSLMIGFQYMWRVFLSVFLSSQIVAFTPAGSILYEAAQKIEDVTAEADVVALLGDDFIPVMATYGGILLLVMLVLVVPVFYRYRMTTYLIMDGQEKGGLRAMLRSRMLMFRRRWALAKLDLSFWWYYLLLTLCASLGMGDLILQTVGVTLPMSDAVAYWVFLSLGLGSQLLVKTLAGPKVEVTYAHCYDRFLNEASLPEPPVEV